MSGSTPSDGHTAQSRIAPLVGAMSGPLAWWLDLQTSYLWAATLCESGRRAPLLGISAIAVCLALVGAMLCWRSGHRPTAGTSDRSPWLSRGPFAFAGLLLNLLSLVAIVALALPKLMLDPCGS
jgi:hypothetical protein